MFDYIEYEYYALIDGKETKVDYCRDTLVGSYCEYEEHTLHNIPYKSIEIGRIENYYILFSIPIIIIILFLIIIEEML